MKLLTTVVALTLVGMTGAAHNLKANMEQYAENQQITDGNYNKSLAVKCINGTFVGKKAENIISYKGIPFVGQQPVGNLRWKAPK
jgi:para-nitrobenzyl esterase